MFCSTSHSLKSAKGKAPSSLSSKPSEKKASALSKSSYSATGSYSVTGSSYLSVSERRKTAEHAKLAARQVAERAQRQLKLLEQSFELERQTIKEEVLVAHKNATLVEHQNLNECLPKEVKGRSLSAQSQSSNSFDENLIQKWVNNSHPQYSLIESDSLFQNLQLLALSGQVQILQFQNFQ